METEANGRPALPAGAGPIAGRRSGAWPGANGRDLGVVCASFKRGWSLWQSAVQRTPTRLSPEPCGFDDIFFGTGDCFAYKL